MKHTTRLIAIMAAVGATVAPAAPSWAQAAVDLPRDFNFMLPMFGDSAWTQDVAGAPVLPSSDQQVLVTYRVLCGDVTDLHPISDPPTTNWPFADVTYDDYAMPVFRAGAGAQDVTICDYDGNLGYPGPKWPSSTLGGPVTVPDCATLARPAGPQDTGADGHLILFEPSTNTAFDFWQATTVRSGPCQSLGGGQTGPDILEAGAADFFDVNGPGTNPDGVSSARAMGTPLLGGMILPEDVLGGFIGHALAFAIPGPRNLSPDPSNPLPSDWFYPAATTETDYYSTKPMALAAGQRLRLKPSLVDDSGVPINENQLAPITQLFLAALRNHGAYMVDNASGFTFTAEDIHTAVLPLPDDDINWWIGESPGTPLPGDKTRWQLLIETLNLELEGIPFAYGSCNGAASTVTTANFEVVEPAGPPSGIFSDGFESGDTDAWSSVVGG